MDLTVLNTSLDEIAIIDVYESFIWTDRYYESGDFELYTAMTNDILSYIKQDYYIVNNQSEHAMIIEKLFISSDVENGNHITITGRSLESILTRRIVWGRTTIKGNLQDAINSLLTDAIINPTDPDRRIPNFIFEYSTDSRIRELTIEAQYTGDNLYDVIHSICMERNLGFKISINDNKEFVFRLYSGTDRSYDQLEVPYVTFSPNFENIINSNYVENKQNLKTITLIGGQGEGSERVYTSVSVTNDTGLNRREVYTDARDISNEENGYILTDVEYKSLLSQRGREKLSECVESSSFEGKTETTIMFRYGEDFFNGDIVQIVNEYGHDTKAQILEIVMVEDSDGSSVYPTFKTIAKEGE